MIAGPVTQQAPIFWDQRRSQITGQVCASILGWTLRPAQKKKKSVANGVWLNGPKSLTHLHVLLAVWHFRFVLQSANLNSASEFASICSQNYVPQNGKEKEI